MDTEALATSTIQRILARCDHLDASISTGDKVPLTDGHIDLYSNATHKSNKYLVGRVQLQVKGKTLEPRAAVPSAFRLKRVDLEGYLKLSGVLFFAVFIREDTEEELPHYAILNPFRIQREISSKPEFQETIAIDLKPLPTETKRVEGIIRLAHQMRGEQPGQALDPDLIERITEISLFTDGSVDFDEPVHLHPEQQDYSVRLTMEGGLQTAAQLELKVVPPEYVGEPANLTVSSGDIEFTTVTRRRIDKSTVALELSESLSIHLGEPSEGELRGEIKWSLHHVLAQRMRDLGFILGCVDNSGFSIGGSFVGWDLGKIADEDELRRHYAHLQTICEVLDFVGARTDLIDLSEVTEKRHQQLRDLHPALVGKKEIRPDSPSHPGRILQPIGRWSIELLCFEGSKPGSLRVQHLLDPDLERQFLGQEERDEGTVYFPATPYELIDEEEFARTLNLGLDRVVEIYSRISEYDTTSGKATATVLKLIEAADQVDARRDEFLESAENLNTWLIEQYGNDPSTLINRFQIVRRLRDLTQEERSQIRTLRQAVRFGEEELPAAFIEVSCAILLDDAEEAEFYFTQLTADQQQQMVSWPIWTLHKRAKSY